MHETAQSLNDANLKSFQGHLHTYSPSPMQRDCAAACSAAAEGRVLAPREIYDTLTMQQNCRTLLDKHHRLHCIDQGKPHAIAGGRASWPNFSRLYWMMRSSKKFGSCGRGTNCRGASLACRRRLRRELLLRSFLKKMDTTMVDTLGKSYSLPLDTAPFKFSSWMGGDRWVSCAL